MLCILGDALGSPKNMVVDDAGPRWSADIPVDAWVMGDPASSSSVTALFEVVNRSVPPIVPPEYVESMIGVARGQVPWPLVIPPAMLREHITGVHSDVQDCLEELGPYADTLRKSREILGHLDSSVIDVHELRSLQVESQAGQLESFEPGPGGMLQPPTYSHRTSTGRLTVVDGPRILTLHKQHRKVLGSRYNGGRMMQIDFVSLEPRVLRLIHAGTAPDDLYSDMLGSVSGDFTRRQAKLATLKSLYGAGSASVGEELGAEAHVLTRHVTAYFGLAEHRDRLNPARGPIRNFWGRPLPEATDPRIAVSHFAQSTAVDVALMGFGSLYRSITEMDLLAVPCFVLHDALLIDAAPEAMEGLTSIANSGVDIPGLGHFPLSLTPAYIEQE